MRPDKIGLTKTLSFVIANIIGVGVFTSLGFQLMETQNVITILSLWIIGGVVALSGSLVYGELGASMPRSGGEYHYLSKIYHPFIGFLSGWTSLTVGFAAPVALACMALGKYFHSVVPFLSPTAIALTALCFLSIVHSFNIKFGGLFQRAITFFNIILIFVFIICGLIFIPKFQDVSSSFTSFSLNEFMKPAFVISLIYVYYAFSGWNASAYIAGDIENPQKVIPKSLFMSAVLVTLLYVLLNFTFLLTTPASALKGQVEVGYISATYIFGMNGGILFSVLISIILISSVSSMIFIGPRVSQVMGEDYKLLKFLSVRTLKGTPIIGLWLQFVISFILIITSSFETVMTYTGFTLNLFTFLAVMGIFVHRYKYKNIERPYKTWGYPYTPIVFLLIMLWTLSYLMFTRWQESLLGFFTIFCGSIIYYLNNFVFDKKVNKN